MIKTGIHDISQLVGKARFKSLLGRDRIISVTLYDQILDLPNAEALAERILLFFTDERGVYKRTYARRFEDFDSQLIRLMTEQFDPNDPLIVADVAVSDGRTACDLFEKLAPRFPRVSHFASDFSPTIRVLRQGSLVVALSRNNQVLETVWPPFVFSAASRENALFYPVNHLIRYLVKRFRVDPLLARHAAGLEPVHELRLFSVRALNMARQDARFHLGEQNIFEPLAIPEPAHVIRAMNVLNPSYFSHEDFDRILENFFAHLRPGGWLVAGSNEEAGSTVHGGIFRKTTAGFEIAWQSGNGPQLGEQIQSWKPSLNRS